MIEVDRFLSDINHIQMMQKHIRLVSEIEQGYVHITFHDGSWGSGTVTCRLTMSGTAEWENRWQGVEDLKDNLAMFLTEALKRKYYKY